MQPLRGTKDILPNEKIIWQYIQKITSEILNNANYTEIETPIIETTELFNRSIGQDTDIINKEMYSFIDQGKRNITLRPEGTAGIARAFISNRMYISNNIQRLWYLGPMFRYERPQNGRQRQFHQLGIECIGSTSPIADAEVIRLAVKILNSLNYKKYNLEINSIGTLEERQQYKTVLINYLEKYHKDLDVESQKRIYKNPLRVLDSKNSKTQEIINNSPKLISHLQDQSIEHFNSVCELLNALNIQYTINFNLVRGLDYYNHTAFEIKTTELGSQDTICGGGRYDQLIEQLGGPKTPSVGWAIGMERLILLVTNYLKLPKNTPDIYLVNQNLNTQKYMWQIIILLEKYKIKFELDLSSNNFSKQIKKAYKSGAIKCIIIGESEMQNKTLTLKNLKNNSQKSIKLVDFSEECKVFIYD